MCPFASITRLMVIPLAVLLFWPGVARSGPNHKRFLSIFISQYSNTTLVENIRFDHDFKTEYACVFSMGTWLTQYKRYLALETEGQLGFHCGSQSYQEFNGLFTLRWLAFPWDRYVNTSFAFGNGISYSTRDPIIEKEAADNQQTSQWLYYIMVEWAFTPPKDTRWDFFWRIHHRSGIYGRMAGNNAGSNFLGIGLRRKF